MRFFDMLNRWESVVAILVVVLALELGLYFFYYLPNRASTPGSSPERTVPGRLEDTAPTTRMEGTVPAAGKSPPVGKSQYSSPGATGP
jgi:hypothetical protein